MQTHANFRACRSGFTMIELMIVVSIIASLMALSIVVMSGFIAQAEEEATSATIQKINRLLEQRQESFERSFVGARRTSYVNATLGLLADPDSNGDRSDGVFGVRDEVVSLLAKKAAARFEFPQRMVELINGTGDSDSNGKLDGDNNGNGLADSVEAAIARPVALQQLAAAGNSAPTTGQVDTAVNANWGRHTAVTESSELLYYTLVVAPGFGSSTVDADRFTQQEVQDTDGDGLPEFVDAWNKPLRFYRWPTRLMDSNPPFPFQPVLANPNEGTDVKANVDTDNDGSGDTIVGIREVTADERAFANVLLRGLPPAPSVLRSGSFPRDLLLTDPDDPVGRLYSELERLNGLNGTANFSVEFNETKYHTPDTYHTPLIVSEGPDEELGLFEPYDLANNGNLAMPTAFGSGGSFSISLEQVSDNITNSNRRAGGRN
jgi:prepilin-type N-terminal cleavage/methylation domain-containing protein